MLIRTRSVKYADAHTDELGHSRFRKHPSTKVIDVFIDQLENQCTCQSATQTKVHNPRSIRLYSRRASVRPDQSTSIG
jgi:hypothetical protein